MKRIFNELMDSLIAVKPELADLIKEKKRKVGRSISCDCICYDTTSYRYLWMDHLGSDMEHMRNSVNLRVRSA